MTQFSAGDLFVMDEKKCIDDHRYYKRDLYKVFMVVSVSKIEREALCDEYSVIEYLDPDTMTIEEFAETSYFETLIEKI